ncbi:MAG TPA: GNAT family N-acetyltransferase [Sphingomicrobium sp.]|jgi:GNAT superfamily N-acetyltransferase|nr:GNAT family N-acetyltransferase [Sphingomicrobium sp.]
MELERATLADLPRLHRLIEGAYRGDTARSGWSHEADLLAGQRIDVETLALMVGDPVEDLLLWRDKGEKVACVALTDKGGGLTYLGLLTVDPSRQASGVGKSLLAAAEAWAAQHRAATRMEMTVIVQRPELIAWYERRGYQLTGERRPFPHGDARFGEPRRPDLEFVVLEKAL